MRESAVSKARRYVCEGRLTVELLDGDTVRARCRGDGTFYDLGHDPNRGWWCTCPVRTIDCAHLIGLRLVAVRSR